MTRLDELLHDAVGPIAPSFAFDDVTGRAWQRRRARTRRLATAAAIVLVLAAVATVAVVRHASTAPASSIHVAPPPPTPTTRTPDVLVFDGPNGIIAVDYAARTAAFHPLDGWRVGDQPFLSLRADDAFVVGWGDVHAVPFASRDSVVLGRGVFVPAVEPGAVWLTSYGQVQTPTERLVDTHGRVLLTEPVPTGATAVTGAPGALVFETASGLEVRAAPSGRVVRRLGSGVAAVAPMHGSLLAWCDDDCTHAVSITDVTTGHTTTYPLTLGTRTIILDRGIRFSPDGTHVAFTAEDRSAAGDVAAELVLIDLDGRDAQHAPRVVPLGRRFATTAWSADSSRLYLAETDTGRGGTVVRYDTKTATLVTIGAVPDAADGLATVLTTRDAARLPSVPVTRRADCDANATSGASNGCAYRF